VRLSFRCLQERKLSSCNFSHRFWFLFLKVSDVVSPDRERRCGRLCGYRLRRRCGLRRGRERSLRQRSERRWRRYCRLRQRGLRRSADMLQCRPQRRQSVYFLPEHPRRVRSPRSSYFLCCLRAWPGLALLRKAGLTWDKYAFYMEWCFKKSAPLETSPCPVRPAHRPAALGRRGRSRSSPSPCLAPRNPRPHRDNRAGSAGCPRCGCVS